MKKLVVIVVAFLVATLSFGQERGLGGPEELIAYNNPKATGYINPDTGLPDDTVEHNDDFTVTVKLQSSTTWSDLWEFKTFVNKFGNDLTPNNQAESTFVNFDFRGAVDVKIICNECLTQGLDITNVTIRPLSREINATFDNVTKTIEFVMTQPENLSVEVDAWKPFDIRDGRYFGVHVFTNTPDPGPPPGIPGIDYYDVQYMNQNLAEDPNSNNTDKPYWFYPEDDKIIYIGGNEVLRGGIWIQGKSGITIRGRGVIDLSRLPKKYTNQQNDPQQYNYVNGVRSNADNGNPRRYPNDITIEGITVNDAQQRPFNITNTSNITLSNVKAISRVIWGAGVYLERVDEVSISNSFFRTTDDCIALYPMRIYSTWSTEGNSFDISVANTSLYADKARAVAIGWHGSQNSLDKASVRDVLFDNIDVLEHDEEIPGYRGALSISCGDFNNCNNITFRDIRVESFTNGSLLNVMVVPENTLGETETDGFRVQNIIFDDIEYNRPLNPSSEFDSYIGGIDECHYVNGVHFTDFTVDGTPVNSESGYDKLKVQNTINGIGPSYVYDLTFNSSQDDAELASGVYFINNSSDDKYLNPTTDMYLDDPEDHYTITAPWNSRWLVTNLGDGLYKIVSKFNDNALTGTHKGNQVSGICEGYAVITRPWTGDQKQMWRFVDIGGGEVRLINDYWGHGSASESGMESSSQGQNYVTTLPWEALSYQKWELTSLSHEHLVGDDFVCPTSLSPTTFSAQGLSGPYLWEVSSNLTIESGNASASIDVVAHIPGTREPGYVKLTYGGGNEILKEVWVGTSNPPTFINGPTLVNTNSVVDYIGGSAEGATSYGWALPHPFEVYEDGLNYDSQYWNMVASDENVTGEVFTGLGGINGLVQYWGVNPCGPGGSIHIEVEHDPNGGGSGWEKSPLFPVPNVANQYFNIDFSSYPPGVYNLTLFDMYSRKIIDLSCSNELINVDTSKIPDGVYYLHLFDGKKWLRNNWLSNTNSVN